MVIMLEQDDEDQLPRPLAAPGSSLERARRLGAFIAQSLAYLGLSQQQFAHRLGMDVELVDSIVAGTLPLSQMDDDLLASMAHHLNLGDGVLSVFRDTQAEGTLPPLPDAEDDDETASARQSIFDTLRDIQDEFSENGHAEGRDTRAGLGSIDAMLNEVREGGPVQPPADEAGPIRLRRIDDTLRSFQNDEE